MLTLKQGAHIGFEEVKSDRWVLFEWSFDRGVVVDKVDPPEITGENLTKLIDWLTRCQKIETAIKECSKR
jgi:hypothetical protein